MRNLIIVITTLLVIIIGWSAWRNHVFNESKIPHRARVVDYESDMTEALVRQIFGDLQKDQPSAFFLAFGEQLTSPSQDFISRFQNLQPPVKNFQASVMPPNGMIIDKASGRVGRIVQIIKIKPQVSGEYEVDVAISKAGPGWDRYTYFVWSMGGEWKVKNRKPA